MAGLAHRTLVAVSQDGEITTDAVLGPYTNVWVQAAVAFVAVTGGVEPGAERRPLWCRVVGETTKLRCIFEMAFLGQEKRAKRDLLRVMLIWTGETTATHASTRKVFALFFELFRLGFGFEQITFLIQGQIPAWVSTLRVTYGGRSTVILWDWVTPSFGLWINFAGWSISTCGY